MQIDRKVHKVLKMFVHDYFYTYIPPIFPASLQTASTGSGQTSQNSFDTDLVSPERTTLHKVTTVTSKDKVQTETSHDKAKTIF